MKRSKSENSPERVMEAMEAIRKLQLTAPVKAGAVVAENFLDTGCDLIVTKSVEKIGV